MVDTPRQVNGGGPSRNNLFTTTWSPQAPVKPLPREPPAMDQSKPAGSPSRPLTYDEPSPHVNQPITPKEDSPRTASFFDLSSNPTISPVPPPKKPGPAPPPPKHGPSLTDSVSPSPINLSRASSFRHAHPPPIHTGLGIRDGNGPLHLEPSSADALLSPLHRSPSLPPISDAESSWRPPSPPTAQNIELRFMPRSTYLLGEGRYATVFLASYRQTGSAGPSSLSLNPETSTAGDMHRVNDDGDGLMGGSWKLCAAKRLAPDRESQTMGLREAFFLNRLAGGSSLETRRSSRGSSPPRNGHSHVDQKRRGRIYVVKLIAVKEEKDSRRVLGHARSSSLMDDKQPSLSRKRSSTFGIPTNGEDGRTERQTANGSTTPLSSFPSLPELAQTSREDSAPSLSRLILLLEHAPLGTLDRFLRNSPNLIGKELWGRWAREGTEALDWIHSQGVVHADVKPGNLLLTADLHLRLSDFGSSLLIHPSQPPQDGVGLGTLPFSPPELVDPNRTFSFPVDIFALGATLYQCITGREPYRGTRTIEMMHHVRRGGLWAWEERARILRIGEEETSVSPSPYPSAWRAAPNEPVKRGGSLRIPRDTSPSALVRPSSRARPRLPRMSSAESLRASEEVLEGSQGSESPAGIRLWAQWMNRPIPPTPTMDAISALLNETMLEGSSPDPIPHRQGPYRPSTINTSHVTHSPSSPLDGGFSQLGAHSNSTPTSYQPPTTESIDGSTPTRPLFSPGINAYSDGTPMMFFLNDMDHVSEDVRAILCAMVDPLPEHRPTAESLVASWRSLGVGEEGSEEIEEDLVGH